MQGGQTTAAAAAGVLTTVPSRIAIIGGGLTGLTAAIRLAETGNEVMLFEAAPACGGRTRSFYEHSMQQLCDNGPHLLVGAYSATRALLQDCAADHHLHWQPSLSLPLWDPSRGHFHFQPPNYLPFAFAMLHASATLPGHTIRSAIAMLRMAIALQQTSPPAAANVSQWLQSLRIPAELVRDMLEPLCLGAMNEAMDTACPHSFKRVLQESFAARSQASLGWFTGPLQTTLIDPLLNKASQLGVNICNRHRVRHLEARHGTALVDGEVFDRAILALPAHAADRLLKRPLRTETRAITNIHLWLHEPLPLPAPLLGCIGGVGQWYFDVSRQWQSSEPGRHLCAVISADCGQTDDRELVSRCLNELAQICASPLPPALRHSRIVREQRATTLVRRSPACDELPTAIIDASERPLPGQLPATIEAAIRRGEHAAAQCRQREYPLAIPL